MRLGVVRGTVVLSTAVPSLAGTRLLVVEPVSAEHLEADDGHGGGKMLIVADHLAPHVGQLIGFVEGREAANPYGRTPVPVDAYCALIVRAVDYRPAKPAAATPTVEVPG
jgi:microcompartment protein CcmK/EutM